MKTEADIRALLEIHRAFIQNAEDMPAYKVLQRMFQLGIERGDWTQGELLPTEKHIAQVCQVSVGTVKKSMQNLVNEGFIYRRQGSGTFVSSVSFNRQERRYYLFLEQFGAKESRNSIVFRGASIVAPIPEINTALLLPSDSPLCEVIRMVTEQNGIGVLCKAYYDARRVKGLTQISRNRFEHVPLFVILEEDFKLVCARSEELFGIVNSAPEEATHLGADPESPLLLIKARNFDAAEHPFEYRITYCHMEEKFLYRTTTY